MRVSGGSSRGLSAYDCGEVKTNDVLTSAQLRRKQIAAATNATATTNTIMPTPLTAKVAGGGGDEWSKPLNGGSPTPSVVLSTPALGTAPAPTAPPATHNSTTTTSVITTTTTTSTRPTASVNGVVVVNGIPVAASRRAVAGAVPTHHHTYVPDVKRSSSLRTERSTTTAAPSSSSNNSTRAAPGSGSGVASAGPKLKPRAMTGLTAGSTSSTAKARAPATASSSAVAGSASKKSPALDAEQRRRAFAEADISEDDECDDDDGDGDDADDTDEESDDDDGTTRTGASAEDDADDERNARAAQAAVAERRRLATADVFSSRAWEAQSKDALLAATAAVDTLCHEIVATKPLFSQCGISKEIRGLALTVAVFERSLVSYALRISRAASTKQQQTTPPPPTHMTPPPSTSSTSAHPFSYSRTNSGILPSGAATPLGGAPNPYRGQLPSSTAAFTPYNTQSSQYISSQLQSHQHWQQQQQLSSGATSPRSSAAVSIAPSPASVVRTLTLGTATPATAPVPNSPLLAARRSTRPLSASLQPLAVSTLVTPPQPIRMLDGTTPTTTPAPAAVAAAAIPQPPPHLRARSIGSSSAVVLAPTPRSAAAAAANNSLHVPVGTSPALTPSPPPPGLDPSNASPLLIPTVPATSLSNSRVVSQYVNVPPSPALVSSQPGSPTNQSLQPQQSLSSSGTLPSQQPPQQRSTRDWKIQQLYGQPTMNGDHSHSAVASASHSEPASPIIEAANGLFAHPTAQQHPTPHSMNGMELSPAMIPVFDPSTPTGVYSPSPNTSNGHYHSSHHLQFNPPHSSPPQHQLSQSGIGGSGNGALRRCASKPDFNHTGGMLSLLNVLSGCLNQIRATLLTLRAISSFSKYYFSHRYFWLLGPGLYLLRNPFLRSVHRHVMRLFGGSPIVRRIGDFSKEHRILTAGASHLLVPAFMYWFWKRALEKQRIVLLHLHIRLGVLLKLWHICTSVLDQHEQLNVAAAAQIAANTAAIAASEAAAAAASTAAVSSQHQQQQQQLQPYNPASAAFYSPNLDPATAAASAAAARAAMTAAAAATALNAALHLGSGDPRDIPLSRWMLELVPPSLDTSFWYKSTWQLALVKYLFDVLYCSVSSWHAVFGKKTIGLPFGMLAAIYYAVSPRRAALRCSEILGSPDIRFVKLVWWLCDSPPVRWWAFVGLPRIGLLPRLAVNEEIVLTNRSSLWRALTAPGSASTATASTSTTTTTTTTTTAGGATNSVVTTVTPTTSGTVTSSGANAVTVAAAAAAAAVAAAAGRPLAALPKINNAHKPIRIRLFSHKPLDVDLASRNAQSSFSFSHAAASAISLSSSLRLPSNRLPSGTAISYRSASGGGGRASKLSVADRRDSKRNKTSDKSNSANANGAGSPVIIYCHGGAYLASFTAADSLFLSRFSSMADAPILYIDYSLAPENAYPTALDECYDVYKWVMGGGLGFHAANIVLAGDSNGANLAVGTLMRAILDRTRALASAASANQPNPSNSPAPAASASAGVTPSASPSPLGDTAASSSSSASSSAAAAAAAAASPIIRLPCALVLACPILNMQAMPTPSRAMFMMDTIAPMNLVSQCRAVYLPPQWDAESDPCLSPVLASDHLLSQFPPTSIVCGGFDPFFDDSIDFAHRLDQVGVRCRLKVYPNLPHAFFHFAAIVPAANDAIKLVGRWLKEGCEVDTQNTNGTELSFPL